MLEINFDLVRYQLTCIKNLIQGPVLRKLGDIESEVKYVGYLLKSGFDDFLLTDLSKSLYQVKDYKKGIISLKNLSPTEPTKQLIKLAFWLRKHSYKQQLTGMLLINDLGGETLFRFSYKQCVSLLYENGYHNNLASIMPVLLYIAREVDGLNFQENSKLPHTTLWARAFYAYLDLRQLVSESDLVNFDCDNSQLIKFENKLNGYIKILKLQFTSKSVIVKIVKKLSSEFLIQLREDLDKITEELDKIQPTLLKSVAGSPKFRIELVEKEKVGVKGVLIEETDLGRQSFLSDEETLGLLLKNFPKLFDSAILLAVKENLVTLKFKLHSSMALGKWTGNQYYITQGCKYGLEIILSISSTNEKFILTSATKGVIYWYEARREVIGDDRTREITKDTHRKALPEKTIVNELELKRAVKKCRRLLKENQIERQKEQRQEQQEKYDKQVKPLLNKLSRENSNLFGAILWLNFLKLYIAASKWETAINIEKMLEYSNMLREAIELENFKEIYFLKEGLEVDFEELESFTLENLTEKKEVIENSCLNELISCQLKLAQFQSRVPLIEDRSNLEFDTETLQQLREEKDRFVEKCRALEKRFEDEKHRADEAEKERDDFKNQFEEKKRNERI